MYILLPLPLGHSVHTHLRFQALSHLNISEPEPIFKYHEQWKDGVSLFVLLVRIFAINIMSYSLNFDLFPQSLLLLLLLLVAFI